MQVRFDTSFSGICNLMPKDEAIRTEVYVGWKPMSKEGNNIRCENFT